MVATVDAVENTRPDGLIESYLVFKGYQDADIRGYRVRGEGATPRPGIVVIPEFRGITEHIRDIGRRLAAQGYTALVMEPFSRESGETDGDDLPALFARMMQLSDVMAVEDVKAAAVYLRSLPFVNQERIGVVGFCMGGLYARLSGCSDDTLTCVVDYYGAVHYDATSEAKPKSPIDLAPELHCPYLGFFGGKDDFIPVAHAHELEQVFREQDKNAAVEIYPDAGHAFLNDSRDTYVEDAAKDAWVKTLAFFTQHLRA